jgi:hypothetical protein
MGFAAAGPGLGGDEAGLRENLSRIVGIARDAGVRLYLMTYPAQRNFYSLANPVITDVAPRAAPR